MQFVFLASPWFVSSRTKECSQARKNATFFVAVGASVGDEPQQGSMLVATGFNPWI
jgi:hypothetical protein